MAYDIVPKLHVSFWKVQSFLVYKLYNYGWLIIEFWSTSRKDTVSVTEGHYQIYRFF